MSKSAENEVKKLFCGAGPVAAQFLITALQNEELAVKERCEIAKEILNRGFGKNLPQADKNEGRIIITLGEETEKYSR